MSPAAPITERWEGSLAPIYGTPELHLVQGKGARVTDSHGQTYLDLLAGLAVNILGHAHPAVVSAVADQIASLGHVSNLYASEPTVALAERLAQMTDGKQAILVNSGSEANETAYKLVRRHAHQAMGLDDGGVILAFDGSFHGRTTAALALTGQPSKHQGFTPFPDGIVHVPYDDPAALEVAFDEHPVAGVFTEIVQGEGGIVPMGQQTATTLEALCDDHGALLVVDEVQTGLGRTGKTWAYQHHDLEPDIVTVAKALGGGLPIGACLATPELAELMGPGSHGCTFGGNPISCAAAHAVLDIYEGQSLDQRAAKLGKALASELAHHDLDHRGMGLLVGLPVTGGTAGDVIQAAQAEGLLVGQAGDDVVRLAPPLIIDEADLLDAVPVLAGCIGS